MNAVKRHARSPAAALEAAFRRIQRERMEGVPLLNPVLRVEALGFAPWQGHWLGALVSPWFVNLVLVPGAREPWVSAHEGERVFHDFPAGRFAFLGGFEPEVGEYQACALCSQMGAFSAQEVACDVGRRALELLQQPPDALHAAGGTARGVAPVSPTRTPAPREPVSRRQFLDALRLREP